jgi:hypothetical protein
MLHDRGQRHVERLRELADRERVARLQPRQQRTAGGVRKCGKGAVEGDVLKLNHVV